MPHFIPILLSFATFVFPRTVHASECTRLTYIQKLTRKSENIKDTIWLWLLMTPQNQISYRFSRADTLYSSAALNTDDNSAYSTIMTAEDHITKIVPVMHRLPATDTLDINRIESSLENHQNIIRSMQSPCEWSKILDISQNNESMIRKIYYLHLPTDTNMNLLNEIR